MSFLRNRVIFEIKIKCFFKVVIITVNFYFYLSPFKRKIIVFLLKNIKFKQIEISQRLKSENLA